MGTILFIVVLLIIGFLAKLVVPILMGLGGAPGALIGGSSTYVDGKKIFGMVISALGQTTIVLLYEVMLIGYIRKAIVQPNVIGWILWIVGFFVAIGPVRSAIGDSVMTEKDDPLITRRNVQHTAISITFYASVVIYIIFAIFPLLSINYFSWLPFV